MPAPTVLMRSSLEQIGNAFENLIALPADEVHVWRVSLDPSQRDMSGLVDLLSGDEHLRADRFKRTLDRDAFVTCRGALRLILGRYTGENPRMIRFEYGPCGKPQIMGKNADSFQFSISHSHTIGIIAMTQGRRVGVDVERIRAVPDVVELAEHCFSQRETAQLKKLPEHLRLEGFYYCWTRKEAFAKALGRGLSLPLDQFVVSLIPGEPAELVDVLWDAKEVMRWSIHDLSIMPLRFQERYIGAIAAEGSNWRLRYGQFEGYPDAEAATTKWV